MHVAVRFWPPSTEVRVNAKRGQLGRRDPRVLRRTSRSWQSIQFFDRRFDRRTINAIPFRITESLDLPALDSAASATRCALSVGILSRQSFARPKRDYRRREKQCGSDYHRHLPTVPQLGADVTHRDQGRRGTGLKTRSELFRLLCLSLPERVVTGN